MDILSQVEAGSYVGGLTEYDPLERAEKIICRGAALGLVGPVWCWAITPRPRLCRRGGLRVRHGPIEAEQLDAGRFIAASRYRGRSLLTRFADWAAFAAGYNGPASRSTGTTGSWRRPMRNTSRRAWPQYE
jgi:hypothetical protein